MREVNVEQIIETVKNLSVEANYFLGSDIKESLKKCREEETYELAGQVFDMIILNSEIAKNEQMPMCQDTGMACVFVEIGQDVHIVGGRLEDAINEGVRRGYSEGFLRKSVVEDPIRRVNTKDNTPAIIYYDIVDGDKIVPHAYHDGYVIASGDVVYIMGKAVAQIGDPISCGDTVSEGSSISRLR